MASRNYQDLIAWQKAVDFAEAVYELTKSFPREEQFALTIQLRRCAVSVPSNIAEGEGRFTTNDFRRFLAITHGSLREAETQLILSQRLRYGGAGQVQQALDQASEVGRLIRGLAKSLDPNSPRC